MRHVRAVLRPRPGADRCRRARRAEGRPLAPARAPGHREDVPGCSVTLTVAFPDGAGRTHHGDPAPRRPGSPPAREPSDSRPVFDEARAAGRYPKFPTAPHRRITAAEAGAA
ncbi:hypothetical protein ACW14Y_40625 [Kitasatospora sp. cg17-2]